MNVYRPLFCFVALSFLLVSCNTHRWVLTDVSVSKIAIDTTVRHLSDPTMEHLIAPYKAQLDREMNVEVGESLVEMDKGKPESLLSNWNADVYRQAASDYLKEPVDISIVNMGGLRAKIPQGKITVRDVFQLMPFENELVILWLTGEQLLELVDIFAKEGGQGVSGLRFCIDNKQPTQIGVAGKSIDKERLYSVATNDYLAAGNDRMIPLASAKKKIFTKLKIRNIVMAYIVAQTQKGQKISAKLDGRIVNYDIPVLYK